RVPRGRPAGRRDRAAGAARARPRRRGRVRRGGHAARDRGRARTARPRAARAPDRARRAEHVRRSDGDAARARRRRAGNERGRMRELCSLLLRCTGLPLLRRELRQRRRLTILVYHAPGPESFERHLEQLRSLYRIIPLRLALDALAGRAPLPPKALVLTL